MKHFQKPLLILHLIDLFVYFDKTYVTLENNFDYL